MTLSRLNRLRHFLLVCFFIVASPPDALAHGAERGLVLLLPGKLYIIGGALSVFASFLMLVFMPTRCLSRIGAFSLDLFRLKPVSPQITSTVSFICLVMLLIAGIQGNTDPLTNPLPLGIWTLWWIVFTLVQCITGSLWRYFNPWTGVYCLICKLTGLKHPILQLPQWIGYSPAVLLFFGFAWFELIYPAPEDPTGLSLVVMGYWCFNLLAMLLFGRRQWFARGEPFSIFFQLVGAMAIFRVTTMDNGKRRVRLVFPGRNLIDSPPLTLSGIAFVLLTLSSVSFDGLSKTFFWLGTIDVNPLEFPGRSAVILHNTAGLTVAFLLLAGLYLLCVYLGCTLVGRKDQFRLAAGKLVYSIIPISIVFHCAHYLTQVLVNMQYAIIAFNDPFALNWNLLGADHFHVTTSFFNDLGTVSLIWTTQTATVVVGHIIGIFVAHVIAAEMFETRRDTLASQIFLAVLMVGYTVFGLWLLSTAAI